MGELNEVQRKAAKKMKSAARMLHESGLLLADGNIVECRAVVGIVATLVEEGMALLEGKAPKED